MCGELYGNQINLKENKKDNNQGFLILTSYLDLIEFIKIGILFFRCQLYVFYSCVDKCLSSKVDAERKQYF